MKKLLNEALEATVLIGTVLALAWITAWVAAWVSTL